MFSCCPGDDPSAPNAELVEANPALGQEERALVKTSADEEAPADKPPEEEPPKSADNDLIFEVRLRRQRVEDSLGLTADFVDEKTVHVCRVIEEGDTCIGKWNASAPDSHKIRVGDYITEVNGLSAGSVEAGAKVSDALRDQLCTSTALLLKVARPVVWESTVQRPSGGLGFKLAYAESGIGLVVTDAAGAAVPMVPALQAGDRIVGANGLGGSTQELLSAIKASEGPVVLKMSRPAL